MKGSSSSGPQRSALTPQSSCCRLCLASTVMWLWLCFAVASSRAQEESTSLTLEHALQPGHFSIRGHIYLKNANFFLLSSAESISSSAQLHQHDLSTHDHAALKQLIANEERYQIRVKLPHARGENPTYVMASIPSCALLASHMEDFLQVRLDQFGNIMSLDYHVANADCSHNSDAPTLEESVRFNTEISVATPKEGSKPLRLAEKPPSETEQKDERGFFAKYWWIIVPVVLLMLLGGVQAPSEAAGGGGGGGGGGGR
ncbi:ER membrane protein complex subunit 10 [Balamuthia mandrillaris]